MRACSKKNEANPLRFDRDRAETSILGEYP